MLLLACATQNLVEHAAIDFHSLSEISHIAFTFILFNFHSHFDGECRVTKFHFAHK